MPELARLPKQGVQLGAAKHALVEYCRAVKVDHPGSKIEPGQFAIQFLVADLIELFAVGETKGGGAGGLDMALAMAETAKAMVEAKAEDGKLGVEA